MRVDGCAWVPALQRVFVMCVVFVCVFVCVFVFVCVSVWVCVIITHARSLTLSCRGDHSNALRHAAKLSVDDVSDAELTTVFNLVDSDHRYVATAISTSSCAVLLLLLLMMMMVMLLLLMIRYDDDRDDDSDGGDDVMVC
jgi:hypothetical protein